MTRSQPRPPDVAGAARRFWGRLGAAGEGPVRGTSSPASNGGSAAGGSLSVDLACEDEAEPGDAGQTRWDPPFDPGGRAREPGWTESTCPTPPRPSSRHPVSEAMEQLWTQLHPVSPSQDVRSGAGPSGPAATPGSDRDGFARSSPPEGGAPRKRRPCRTHPPPARQLPRPEAIVVPGFLFGSVFHPSSDRHAGRSTIAGRDSYGRGGRIVLLTPLGTPSNTDTVLTEPFQPDFLSESSQPHRRPLLTKTSVASRQTRVERLPLGARANGQRPQLGERHTSSPLCQACQSCQRARVLRLIVARHHEGTGCRSRLGAATAGGRGAALRAP